MRVGVGGPRIGCQLRFDSGYLSIEIPAGFFQVLKVRFFLIGPPNVFQDVAQVKAELPRLYDFDRFICGVAAVVRRMVNRFVAHPFGLGGIVFQRSKTFPAHSASGHHAGFYKLMSLHYVRSHSYLGMRWVFRGPVTSPRLRLFKVK